MGFKEQMEAEWKIIADRDAIAKMNNTLVGRYLKYAYADGYAFYEIWAVNKGVAYVHHINYGDGWTFPMIEQMNCQLPVGVVMENIKHREGLEELFKK